MHIVLKVKTAVRKQLRIGRLPFSVVINSLTVLWVKTKNTWSSLIQFGA